MLAKTRSSLCVAQGHVILGDNADGHRQSYVCSHTLNKRPWTVWWTACVRHIRLSSNTRVVIPNANVFAVFRHNGQLIRVVIVMCCNFQWIHPARLSTQGGFQFLNIAIPFVCQSNAVPIKKSTLDQHSQWHFGFLHAL